MKATPDPTKSRIRQKFIISSKAPLWNFFSFTTSVRHSRRYRGSSNFSQKPWSIPNFIICDHLMIHFIFSPFSFLSFFILTFILALFSLSSLPFFSLTHCFAPTDSLSWFSLKLYNHVILWNKIITNHIVLIHIDWILIHIYKIPTRNSIQVGRFLIKGCAPVIYTGAVQLPPKDFPRLYL